MARPRLLDLTRSLRRASRMATGVDRVERAYLDRFLQGDLPVYGLFRTAFGYVLLDAEGLRGFRDRLSGKAEWPTARMMSRLPKGRDATLMQAETYVRGCAVMRCLPTGLRRMLARQMPQGCAYYNVGHSNLTERVLRSVKIAQGDISVLIHDIIPIEFPQYQRREAVRSFEDKLCRVGKTADRVIYNSQDTMRRAEEVLRAWGRVPPGIVAHLGTIESVAKVEDLSVGVMPKRPYFVTVGTIEPRKNHAFLLDLWEKLGVDAPPLLICGSRGWNNDAVFSRLDALPAGSPVREVAGLSDAGLMALVGRSAGSLFPSHAEGFGLPPIEALQIGARVLCNDLPVLHEILGTSATFAPVSKPELWLKTIKNWETTSPPASRGNEFTGPSWADHFKIVLRLT